MNEITTKLNVEALNHLATDQYLQLLAPAEAKAKGIKIHSVKLVSQFSPPGLQHFKK